MGVEEEVDRHAMVVAHKRKKECIEEVLTVVPAVPDPPQARGVKAAPETGKQRLTWNASIVARRATRRVSDVKSTPIRRKPDPDPGGPNKEIGSGRTTPKDRKDLKKLERGQPS